MLRRRLRLFACVLALTAAIAACFGATEIRLEITSNASCHDLQTGETLVFVSSTGHRPDAPVADTRDCREEDGHSTIGSLVLVPSGERTAKLSVEVVTSLGKAPRDCTPGHLDGCIVARRRLNYRRHAHADLPIAMRVECIGVDCPEDQTCVLGTCRPADIATSLFCDETTCDAGTGPQGDAAVAPDAGGEDASALTDGAADAAVDAGPPLPCPGAETAPLRISSTAGTTSYNLSATATDLYWVDTIAGDVWGLPKLGGSPTRWATGEDTPYSVVRDATALYWTGVAGLRDESTPNTAKTAIASTAGNGGGPIVAGNGGVYWFSSDSNQIVFSIAAPAGGVSASRPVTSGANISPWDMAFDGTNVYWTNRGTGSAILRVAGSASAAAPELFAAATSPAGIAVDATHVYWADGGNILTQPKDKSAASVPLAIGQDNPGGIAVAGTDVYFANLGLSPTFAGNVAHVSTAGGPVVKIASGRAPTFIVADERCVYWLQRDVNEVWKASR